jgi:hypothetical protein
MQQGFLCRVSEVRSSIRIRFLIIPLGCILALPYTHRVKERREARRWVVERTLGWLSKCRAILVRYEKKAANYLGLIKVACILLWYRRQHRLYLLR